MIDERKRQAIELLIEGRETKSNIANIVGVSRQCLYNWFEDKEFMAEMDSRLQQIKNLAEKEFNSKLPRAIDEYWHLIQTTKDSRTKEKALAYWIDRSLGKVTTKHEITAKQDTDKVDDDILQAEIEEWESEFEE